jgi:hypothetical protein
MLGLPLALISAGPLEIVSSSSPCEPIAMCSSALGPLTQPLIRSPLME